MNDSFARLGGFMYRARWLVLGAWVVVLGVSIGLFAPKANGVLKAGGIEDPKSESAIASRMLADQFANSSLNTVVIVFHSADLPAEDPAYRAQVTAAAEKVQSVKGVKSVTTYYQTGLPNLISPDRRTTVAAVSLIGNESTTQLIVPDIRAQLTGLSLDHYVTGAPAINNDFQKTSEVDLKRSEMVTIPLVLVLLLLTFRTVIAAAVPLVLGAASVVTALAAIYLIGSRTDVSIFALNVASMIGLGLGIDFSLIVVNRFREELAKGRDPRTATMITMATAGRSITYSGVTVLLGMLVLTLMINLMAIRSISLGVALVATTAVLGGLTLLPAILGILGHRLEWLRVIPRRKHPAPEQRRFWYRLSHAIMERPWAWLLVSVAVLFAIALPARELKLLGSSPGLLPRSSESVKGINALDAQFGTNLLTPIQVVLKTKDANGVWTPDFLTKLDTLTNTLKSDPRTANVTSLATYEAAEPRDGRYQNITPFDFMPAPAVDPLDPDPDPPGIGIRHMMSVWVDSVPYNPAYFGFARFQFAAGTNQPLTNAPALQVYLIQSGSLTVQAGGPISLTRAADFGQRDKAQAISDGSAVTLQPGDQLVVPPQTDVTLSTSDAPVDMLAAVIFQIRPGLQTQDSWTEGAPSSDPFVGIPRDVIGGGVGQTFPTGPANIKIDLASTAPGAWFPRHLHPGPELIVVQSGTLTIFSSPEMVMTDANGQMEPQVYDTPVDLGPRGKAVVQGYGIHRATDRGSDPAVVYSLRVVDAAQPAFSLVGVTELGAQFVNINSTNDTTVLNIVTKYGPYDPRQERFVSDLRDIILPGVIGNGDYQAYVGGQTANFMDFRDKLYGQFPYLVGAVLLLTFIILMMFFQSVFLPLKAILMNLASILATYGALVLIFQRGWGAGLFGFEPLGAIGVITPAILFVILFSLSTDYEVFMLSRIKEYYHATGDNEESVAAGLQHTAGVVTAAGLILIGVFGSFATAGIVTVKEIGLGLAIAVFLDTTIVRTIMVPATMRLMGDRNWAMPAWLKRIIPELREGPVGDLVPVGAGAGLAGSGAAGAAVDAAPTRPRMAGQLRPTGGPVGTELIVLPRARPFRIGRDAESDLQVFDPRVSRRHGQIEHQSGEYVITDLTSTNGIFVNGRRIAEPVTLAHGDVVEIANTGELTFAFELRPLSEAPQAAGPAPAAAPAKASGG